MSAMAARSLRWAASPSCLRMASKLSSVIGFGGVIITGWQGAGGAGGGGRARFCAAAGAKPAISTAAQAHSKRMARIALLPASMRGRLAQGQGGVTRGRFAGAGKKMRSRRARSAARDRRKGDYAIRNKRQKQAPDSACV